MKFTPVSLAILAIGMVATAIGVYEIADTMFSRRGPTADSVVAVFRAQSPKFVEALQTGFPQDYDALVARAISLKKDGASSEDLQAALSSASADIADKYADYARRAPEAELKSWLDAVANAIEAIHAAGGATLCQKFLDQGADALQAVSDREDLQQLVDARDAALLTAIAAARSADLPAVDAPTETDWAAVDQQMRAAHVPANYGDLLIKNDAQNPNYCPALVELFRNIEIMPGEPGRRIRAEYLANAVS